MLIFVLGIDLGKNVCSLVVLDEGRRSASAPAPPSRWRLWTLSANGALHCGDGSLLRRASPWASVWCQRSHNPAYIAGISATTTMPRRPRKPQRGRRCGLCGALAPDGGAHGALINHLRALLLERGIVGAQGRRKVEDVLGVFADEDDVLRKEGSFDPATAAA